MHKSKAADLQGVPQKTPDFWALCEHRMGNQCPSLGLLMPDACSVDARRLVPKCPLDGQDRPPDGLIQNGWRVAYSMSV